jgi:hypothetical protein
MPILVGFRQPSDRFRNRGRKKYQVQNSKRTSVSEHQPLQNPTKRSDVPDILHFDIIICGRLAIQPVGFLPLRLRGLQEHPEDARLLGPQWSQ